MTRVGSQRHRKKIIVSSNSSSISSSFSSSIITKYDSRVRWSGTICSLRKGRHWHGPQLCQLTSPHGVSTASCVRCSAPASGCSRNCN